MPPTKRYRLKLRSLSFLSAVDRPAQETATALLIKRAPTGPGFELAGSAPVVKVDESLGLVFAWAWTSTKNGEEYSDLQGDVVATDDDAIAAAAAFMEAGGAQDTMHDGAPDGRVVFAMPMNAEIALAYGVKTDTTGLMIAIRPSPATLAKFKSGELTGISLAGMGEREEIAEKRAEKRAQLTDDADGHAHLVEAGLDAGETSYGTTTGGVGHSHPFIAVDGVVKIGAAAGHTHTVGSEKPAAVAPPAPGETDAEKFARLDGALRAARGAAFRKKAGSPEHAEVDRLEKEIGPVRAAIYHAAHAPGGPVDVAKAAEAVEKALEVELRKLHDDADVARKVYEAKVVEIAKRDNVSTSYARGIAAEEHAALRQKFSPINLRERELELRVKAATSSTKAAFEKARATLDHMAEEFALRHDVDMTTAREKVEALPTGRELAKEARKLKDTLAAAPLVVERAMAKGREAAAAKRKADERAEAIAAADARRTPTEKAFHARVQAIMTEKGLDLGAATTHAIDVDEEGSALWIAARAAKNSARRAVAS